MWRTATGLGLRGAALGGVAPMLAATAVSSYADYSAGLTAQSAPPVEVSNSKTTSSDCVSATALLVFRGLGAGLAWTIGVDGYMLASATEHEWRELLAARPGSTKMREAARRMAYLGSRNMFGFAAFLGIFGGVSCSLEKLRARSDLLNPFAGGFVAAMAILPGELRKPRALLGAALLCGSASMALHFFIPTNGENRDGKKSSR